MPGLLGSQCPEKAERFVDAALELWVASLGSSHVSPHIS